MKGEERRTVPALRCGGLFSRSQRSWSSTSDAPCHQPIRPAQGGPARRPGTLPPRPRQGSRLLRSRAPSIDRCPFAARLRRLRRDRHRPRGVSAYELAPDTLLRHPERLSGRRFRSLPTVQSQIAALPSGQGVSPVWTEQVASCRLLQSLRFLSTTTELTSIPARPTGSCPPVRR